MHARQSTSIPDDRQQIDEAQLSTPARRPREASGLASAAPPGALVETPPLSTAPTAAAAPGEQSAKPFIIKRREPRKAPRTTKASWTWRCIARGILTGLGTLGVCFPMTSARTLPPLTEPGAVTTTLRQTESDTDTDTDTDKNDTGLKEPNAQQRQALLELLRCPEYLQGSGEDAAVRQWVDAVLKTTIAAKKAPHADKELRAPAERGVADNELDDLVATAKENIRRSKLTALADPEQQLHELLGAISDTLDEYDKKRQIGQSDGAYAPPPQSG